MRQPEKATRAGLCKEISFSFEQPFELYHNAFSLCSMKVRLCLSELAIPYKSHHIDLIETGFYENIRRDFKHINPGCTVPVLLHNGHPVYESHEQIRYAASQSEADVKTLLPDDAQKRATMDRWIDLSSLTDNPLENTHLSAGNAVPGQTLPLFTTMIEKIPYYRIAEGFLRHFDKRRPAMFCAMKFFGLDVFNKVELMKNALRASSRNMHRHLDEFERQLTSESGTWVLGKQFTLADVSWCVIFERLRQAESLELFVTPNNRPACHAWWLACTARPSYQQAIMAHEHPIVLHGSHRLRALKETEPAVAALYAEQIGRPMNEG